MEENKFILLNVYAPTKDKMNHLHELHLHELILMYSDKNLLIGGDFNVCLNPDIDKKGDSLEKESQYCTNLLNFMNEFTLTDIWGIRNKNTLHFTRRERLLVDLLCYRISDT